MPGKPAARAGDTTGCGSALSGNLIIPNVLINGRPVATLGSLGDHGNVIIVDSGTVIIGFSRGAAAARHFANQVLLREQGPLGDLRHAGKLGLAADFDWRNDVIINFIGMFETVAAIGGWDDWGDPSDNVNGGIDLYLAPDAARQVVHLVARDEFRRNFALNQVSPPHREIVLPGAHSDLGGGYQPLASERLYLMRPRTHTAPRPTSRRNATPNTPVRPTCSTRRTVRRGWVRISGNISHPSAAGAATR